MRTARGVSAATIAMMTFHKEGPNAPMRAKANNRFGIAHHSIHEPHNDIVYTPLVPSDESNGNPNDGCQTCN